MALPLVQRVQSLQSHFWATHPSVGKLTPRVAPKIHFLGFFSFSCWFSLHFLFIPILCSGWYLCWFSGIIVVSGTCNARVPIWVAHDHFSNFFYRSVTFLGRKQTSWSNSCSSVVSVCHFVQSCISNYKMSAAGLTQPSYGHAMKFHIYHMVKGI